MALLVTVARYATITGDTSTSAAIVSQAIEDATAMLSEELGRGSDGLKSDERDEVMRVAANGDLYPLAVPVTAVDGYDTFTTHTIYGASADVATSLGLVGSDLPATVTVTYTGGWLERIAAGAVPTALPAYMERDIAWAAHAITHPSAVAAVPVGAGAASVGDASLSWGGGGAPAASKRGVGWSSETLRWRRRRP